MRRCKICGREGTRKELVMLYIKPSGTGGWRVYLCEQCFNNLKRDLGFL